MVAAICLRSCFRGLSLLLLWPTEELCFHSFIPKTLLLLTVPPGPVLCLQRPDTGQVYVQQGPWIPLWSEVPRAGSFSVEAADASSYSCWPCVPPITTRPGVPTLPETWSIAWYRCQQQSSLNLYWFFCCWPLALRLKYEFMRARQRSTCRTHFILHSVSMLAHSLCVHVCPLALKITSLPRSFLIFPISRPLVGAA